MMIFNRFNKKTIVAHFASPLTSSWWDFNTNTLVLITPNKLVQHLIPDLQTPLLGRFSSGWWSPLIASMRCGRGRVKPNFCLFIFQVLRDCHYLPKQNIKPWRGGRRNSLLMMCSTLMYSHSLCHPRNEICLCTFWRKGFVAGSPPPPPPPSVVSVTDCMR